MIVALMCITVLSNVLADVLADASKHALEYMTMQIPVKPIEFELEQKRSRFIAYVIPMTNESELKDLQTELRQAHPKASHVCYGFRMMNAARQICEGFSDDGEPSGTSGPPILKVLQHKDLINCGVLVVRYFGGTKLGTGGLQRSYSQSTSDAIAQYSDDDFIEWEAEIEIVIRGSFERESDLRRELTRLNSQISEESYNGDGFQITAQLTEAHYEKLTQTILARHLKIRALND